MCDIMGSPAGDADEIVCKVGKRIEQEVLSKSNNSADDDLLVNPMAKVEQMVEKRIRNLEKRKQKLMQYAEQMAAGEFLSPDQVEALSKLGEVVQQVVYFNEMQVNIQYHAKSYQKALKKTERRKFEQRQLQEKEAFCKLLQFRTVINNTQESDIRQYLEKELSEKHFHMLDKLYTIFNPTFTWDGSTGEIQSYIEQFAQNSMQIIHGSKKIIVDDQSGLDLRYLLERLGELLIIYYEKARKTETTIAEPSIIASPKSSDSGVDSRDTSTPPNVEEQDRDNLHENDDSMINNAPTVSNAVDD